MSVENTSMIGDVAAQLMDDMDEIDGEIEEVLIVVAVNQGDSMLLRMKCSNERAYVQYGLAHGAEQMVDEIWVDEDDAE